jgi:hypothetical protein
MPELPTATSRDLALWTPSTALSIEQEASRSVAALKYATSPQEALRQVKRLVSSWPHARPPDPEGWAASMAAVLAQYPLGIAQECCDPRVGLAKKREFPPTVAAIDEWCKRRLDYHHGMIKWDKQNQLVKSKPIFGEEHRRGMMRQLRDLMHRTFLRAPTGDPGRIDAAPPTVPVISPQMQALRADLEARKARKAGA